jgi:transcriptional regulator with XRE-family HTH domain
MGGKRDLDPAESPMHFFGAEVRRAREAAGMTQTEFGATVPCDGSVVSKVEAGTLAPTERFAAACDEAFPYMAGWFTRFYQDARRWGDGPYPSWFQPFVAHEAAAQALRTVQHSVMPGLLQTRGYARAVLGTHPDTSEEKLDELVAGRLDRQVILDRVDPPRLWAVIDEAVLHREAGDAKVMHDQLLHLADMAARPNVTVEVIPYGAGAHSGLLGAFVIADFRDDPSIVYLETADGGQLVEQPAAVARVALVFDTLRSEALPRRASRDVIIKVAEEKWT